MDQSVLERLSASDVVQSAVDVILEADHELCCSSLTLDGFASGARSMADFTEGSRRMRTSFLFLPTSPETDQLVLDIRTALWRAGTGRVPGVLRVAVAATAVAAKAILLHYDRGLDHIADVYPPLKAQWVVPPGSIR
jgi:predicted nucleic acid-binding protein